MFKRPTLSTKLGWILILLLGGLSFVPWNHWILQASIGGMMLICLIYVYFATTLVRGKKQVHLTVESVPEEKLPQYKNALTESLALFGVPKLNPTSKGDLIVNLETDRTLAQLLRKLKRCPVNLRMVKTTCNLRYSALAASAEMLIEINGSAAPLSVVEIPGLEQTVHADKDGAFRVKIPYSLVKKYSNKGFIPATWTKDKAVEKIKIPISD